MSERVFSHVHSENKLLSAVYFDLKVMSYLAGCRTLDLIDKFVTGPSWRVIEKESHILHMNVHYQRLLKCFEDWAEDAGKFLSGENSVFQDASLIHQDVVLESLVEGGSDDKQFWDGMMKQCPQLIFASFVAATKRLLSDHLKGGILENK